MEKVFGLNYFNHPYSFPRSSQPHWGKFFDRWYQLDAYSYGMVDAFYNFKAKLETPDMLLLASPFASNDADRQFVLSKAKKPAKMVHTLPNVRCSALINLMGWAGPVLCIQKDPQTILTALLEGIELLDQDCRNLIIWGVVNCLLFPNVTEKDGRNKFEVNIFSLTYLSQEGNGGKGHPYIIKQEESDPSLEGKEDKSLIEWLLKIPSENEFEINPRVTILKNKN